MIAQFFIAVRQQVEGIAQQVRGRCYCGGVILGGIIRVASICWVFQLYPVQRVAQFDVRGPMFLGIWIFPRKDNELYLIPALVIGLGLTPWAESGYEREAHQCDLA